MKRISLQEAKEVMLMLHRTLVECGELDNNTHYYLDDNLDCQEVPSEETRNKLPF